MFINNICKYSVTFFIKNINFILGNIADKHFLFIKDKDTIGSNSYILTYERITP